MSKFISEVFPAWGDGKTQLQLTARKNKKSIDAEFVTTPKELAQVLTAWKAYDVYYTVVVFSSTTKEKFKRLPHTIGINRKHVILDFDYKDQIEEFRNPASIYKSVSKLAGKPHMIVSSGNGVHLYYKVRTNNTEKLLDLQLRTINAFSQHGEDLPIIDKRTCRTERDLIRLPGSTNQSASKLVGYKIIDPEGYLQVTSLPAFKVEGFKALKIKPAAGDSPYAADYQAPYDGDPAYIEFLLKECAAAALFVSDSENSFEREEQVRGNHEDVINWAAITNFTESIQDDEVNHYHNMIGIMENYPGSSRDWIEKQVDSVKYPRGCTRWSDDYRPACKGCKYFTEYSGTATPTPIGAAKMAYKKSREVIELKQIHKKIDQDDEAHLTPMGKYVFLDGMLHKYRGDNKAPLLISATSFRLLKGKTTVPDRGSYVMVRIYHKFYYDDRVMKIRGTDSAQLEALASLGIAQVNKVGKTHNPKEELLAYLRHQISFCVQVQYYLGWSKNRAQFAFPEVTYQKDKTGLVHEMTPPIITHEVSRFVKHPKSDASNWWTAANQLFFQLPEMAVYGKLVLASFASVLYYFLPIETGVKGHTMVLVGPPGCGKTVALNAASSVWGHNGFTNTKSDTFPSLINSLGANPFLPVTFDDIMRSGVSLKDDDVAQLTHTITEGRSRARSRTDGDGNLATQEFSTMLLSTSNESLRRMVAKQQNRVDAAGAGMDRITEHYCREQSAYIKTEYGIDIIKQSNELEPKLKVNGGASGREFIRYIMPRRSALMDLMRTNYTTMHHRVGNKRHEAKFLAALDTARQILQNMGRLQAVSDAVIFGSETIESYKKETADIKQVAFTDSVPSATEFSKFYGSTAMKTRITKTHNKINMEVLPAMESNMSLWTGLPMWEFEKANTLERFKKKYPRHKVHALGFEPNLMAMALKKMGCTKPPREVIKTWHDTGQVTRLYTKQLSFNWLGANKSEYKGVIIAWPI